MIMAVVTALAAVGTSIATTVMQANAASDRRREAKRQSNVQEAQQSKLRTEQDQDQRREDIRKRTRRMDQETQARIQKSQAGLIGQPLGGETTLLGG